MRTRPKITSIEIIQYELTLQDVAPEPTIGIPVYKPGSVMQRRRHAIRIHSDIGVTGAYSGGSPMDYAAIAGFASCLLGRNPLQREDIYNDFKQAMRQQARMGVGVVDIALVGDAQELSKWAKMSLETNPGAIQRRREVRNFEQEWRFAFPTAVVFDAHYSRLIVADTQRNRLQLYNKLKHYQQAARTI